MQGKNFNTEDLDCMSLEGFSKVVQMDIQKKLGKDFQVQVHEITKNNGITLKGLIIQEKRSNISPTIYLESYYQNYKEEKYTLEQLEQQIMECYCECKPDGSVNVHTFQDWEVAKHRIVYKLINYWSEVVKLFCNNNTERFPNCYRCLFSKGVSSPFDECGRM